MPFSVMNLNTLFFVERFCRIMDFGKGPICNIFYDQMCLFISVLLETEYKILNFIMTLLNG